MRSILLLLFLAVAVVSCTSKRASKPRVLVFSKTAGYHHKSIPVGQAAIIKLGQENGFEVDTTSNAAYFTEDSLRQYSTVVFLNTTGNVLDYRQEASFERYVQAGGGFVGVHAAADSEYDWGWYGRLLGAYFLSHPEQQQARYLIKDRNFAATKSFPDSVYMHFDELYNYKKLNPDVHVLITVDEQSYKGGANGNYHPMSWYHDFEGGRAFYTAMGHVDEAYSDEIFLKHLLGGIQYAIGENNNLDYSKAKTQMPPEADRFMKTQLVSGEFYEPTELTVLPNLDVVIIQRRGEVMLYKNDTKKLKQVGFLNVYFKSAIPKVNAEEGLLGLAKDPNFAKNNYLFLYYSAADSAVNRLSRFTFKNDTLDLTTEVPILEVKSQRDICCHTGGSIAFGPDGLLYVSSGDNSTPFDEPGQKYVNHGFGPLNDEPGHKQYDARRSSGNTNDLRGKIMRIRVKEDGTYEIPDGNLFPPGTPKTRPEIYVMGNRNPYRISIDQKNSYLYWGEVGPDANNDSLEVRGPRGYDELNQARKAGNFGWPLFVGNNYPYREYNYVTGKSGAAFDPLKPINNSRNNTGLIELPPIAPSFIWYPYGVSKDFPQVATGGRNAMAGPVFYSDLFPKETRLPDYYNGKVLIYDWIRGWVKAVTLNPNGDFDKMEPFAPNLKVNNMIDMEIGPDGRLYLLEYGSGWFAKNDDAGLSRLDYLAGNRPPAVNSITTDKTSGTLPFAVKVSAEAKDPENDKITYVWDFGNGTTTTTDSPETTVTYTVAGDFAISVTAKDDKGDGFKSTNALVYAGNASPVVTIETDQTSYEPGKAVNYKVIIKDDGLTEVDQANLFVSVQYVEGLDKASRSMGHQQVTAAIIGKNMTQTLDCKSCHKESAKSIGPSFKDVAERYKGDTKASAYLRDKIVKGGGGQWGEVAMAAHPSLSKTETSQLVSYILSLSGPSDKKSLPQAGSITPDKNVKPGSMLVITATYTDKGGNDIKPLTGTGTAILPLQQ